MEGDDYGDGYDGHVYAEPQIGEESSFIGTVIACIAVGVVEEEGAKERREAENGGSRRAVRMPMQNSSQCSDGESQEINRIC